MTNQPAPGLPYACCRIVAIHDGVKLNSNRGDRAEVPRNPSRARRSYPLVR
jgi:hypothetical protein